MTPIEYGCCALAGVMFLFTLKMWWSTSGKQLREYKALVDEGMRTLQDRNTEIDKLREAEHKWREANRLLRAALKEKEDELGVRDREIEMLKNALERQKAANETLTEVIGKQEQHIKENTRDITMLKDQVMDLRAKLGMQP